MPAHAPSSSLPAWITSELIADTRGVWEPVYGRPLTNDEIIEILLNAAGVLRALFGLRSSATTVHRELDGKTTPAQLAADEASDPAEQSHVGPTGRVN